MKGIVFGLLVLLSSVSLAADNLGVQLQNLSVTIRAGNAQGSGVLITREVKVDAKSNDVEKVNFCWTAAHVVDHLRRTREVVDPKTGVKKTVVEFGNVNVVKELNEGGRRVGEYSMEAKVIKYSDADHGRDLALLMLYKRNFISDSAEFYLSKDIPQVGTQLIHVGSLLGQFGANSVTTGPLSQTGRVLNLTGNNGIVFDQSSCPAFPGSSGGGIFFNEGENKGKYLGMLVRGAGETFNFLVPVREMVKWAERNNVSWALDNSVTTPTLEDISKITIEDEVNINNPTKEATKSYPFLIHTPGPAQVLPGEVAELRPIVFTP